VLKAASDERARRRAAEFDIALTSEANEILLDPDLSARQGRLDSARKRLAEQFRPGSFGGSPREFDSSVGLSFARHSGDLKAQTDRDGIAQATGDNDFQLDNLVEQFALSNDPAEQALALQTGELALERAVESGIRSQSQADLRLKQFRQDAMGGTLRRLQNDDPATGLSFLNSSFQGTEEERQVWRGHMMRALSSRASAEESRRNRSSTADTDRAKVLSEEAEKELIDLSAGDGVSVDDVLSRVDLSTIAAKFWMGKAQGGGRITQPAQSQRDIYLALSTGADMGHDIVSTANAMYASELLTKSDRDALVRVSRDRRFGDARTAISLTLDAGIFGDPFIRGKKVQALQFFDDFVRNNPNATLEEAQTKANGLIDSALTLYDPSNIETANLRPEGAILNEDGKTVQIVETLRTYKAALDEGRIDEFEYGQRVKMIQRISDAQDAKSARDEKKAQ
jgi:hypothetical protein